MSGSEMQFLLGLVFIALGLFRATKSPISGCVIAGIGVGLLNNL